MNTINLKFKDDDHDSGSNELETILISVVENGYLLTYSDSEFEYRYVFEENDSLLKFVKSLIKG